MHGKMKVLVPVADGAEEIETVSIADVLRRAEIDVTLASIHSKSTHHQGKSTDKPLIQGSRGIGIQCDHYFEDVQDKDFDCIVLPGGAKGAENLSKCHSLIEKLKKQKEANKWYAAICASPAVVFLPNHLLDGVEATCYPSFGDKFPNKKKLDQRVVVSHNCITSQGPGTAIEFALVLVEKLLSYDKASQVGKGLLAYIPK